MRAPRREGLAAVEDMVGTVRAAVGARRDSDFVVCARTDAAAVEGLDAAVDRAKAYVDAGADMIFAEAVSGPADIERFRAGVAVPLLVNMTEFGRSELLSATTLADLGVDVVIYPVTLFRLAMGAVADGLRMLAAEGTQTELVERMQTREQLYEVLDYDTSPPSTIPWPTSVGPDRGRPGRRRGPPEESRARRRCREGPGSDA
jgi:methylisocitrate lyase